MATYTARTAKHATLTTNTVDTVTLDSAQHVEIINRDGSGDIYATVNGSTPTVGGDNTLYIGPCAARVIPVPGYVGDGTTTVHLISTTACAYSVTREA